MNSYLLTFSSLRACSVRILLLTLIALYLSPQQTIAADKQKRSLQAVIKSDASNAHPIAEIEIGSVESSESLNIEALLLNESGSELIFNDVQVACNCTKVSPSSGKLRPGERLNVNLQITAAEIPTGVVGGGIVNFLKDKEIVFEARFSYGLGRHIGFPTRLIVVSVAEGMEKVDFTVPLVVSEGVLAKDISIEPVFSDETIDLSYEVDLASQQLKGTITLKADPGFTKIFGSLEVTDLETGKAYTTPVILERRSRVSIYPRFLRFMDTSPNKRNVATFFITFEATDEESTQRIVSVHISGKSFPGVVSRVNRKVDRVLVEMSNSDLDDLKQVWQSTQDKPKHAKVIVQHKSGTLEAEVPFLFQERHDD